MGWNIFKSAACRERNSSFSRSLSWFWSFIFVNIQSHIRCFPRGGMADSRFCSDLNPIIFLTTIIKKYGEDVLGESTLRCCSRFQLLQKWLCGSPIKINIYIIYLVIAMYTNVSWTDTKQVNCSPHLPFNTSHHWQQFISKPAGGARGRAERNLMAPL